jgi:capsid protein
MPSFLESIKNLFSPTVEQKAATIPQGGYESAANYSTDRSYLYIDSNIHEENSLDCPEYAREEILRFARYLVRNFSLCERIVTLSENYAVGCGISAQASTTDNEFNPVSTAYYENWSRSPFSSTSNELTVYQMQKLIVRELIIAGEIFIVLSKADSGYPQLTLVASEQIRHSGKKNDKSVGGLFLDSFGKVTSYQIYFSSKPTIIDAANVIHIKVTKTIGQKRGVSSFAASLNSMRDLKDLQMLEKKAVKLHSSLGIAVTKNSGEAGQGVFNNVMTTTQTQTARPPANRALEKAFPGATIYLSPGEEIKPITSDRSTDGFLKFLELLSRDVCLNLSIPWDFVVDPSALTSAGTRFIISDADVFFRNLQHLVIDGGLGRIYTWVTASAIKDGKVPACKDPNFYTVNWVMPQSITIDKGREDKAILDFVDNGLMSLDTYYSSRGKNYKDELRQIAQEKQLIKELEAEYDVTLKSETKQKQEVGVTEEPEEEEIKNTK